jgi:hypothetical protein
MLYKLTTKWRNVCMSCLFDEFDVHIEALFPIIFAYRTVITPTDVIVQMQ